MSSEAEQNPPPPDETDEKQLCVSCAFPNEASAHFCVQCGAPLTSYASTGPMEHIFAEGAAYRQASARPRNLTVVLGMWLIFGMPGLAGLIFVVSRNTGIVATTVGGFALVISVALIWRTTRNYLARKKTDADRDDNSSADSGIGDS